LTKSMNFAFGLLIVLFMLSALTGCPDEASDDGTAGAEACSTVCPIGSNVSESAEASAACSAEGEGEKGIVSSGEASYACAGSGSCMITCEVAIDCSDGTLRMTRETDADGAVREEIICDRDVEPCWDIDCDGRGTCQVIQDAAECICDEGYENSGPVHCVELTVCDIGGETYENGQANPANPCLVCDTSSSFSQWSDNNGASCDDGVFCNGEDTCLSGACAEHDDNPCPDDGFWCNGAETCDEENNSCEHENTDASNPRCADDGLFCNGPEECDEDNDQCTHAGDPCDVDGLWCNGDEYCDEPNQQCAHQNVPCADDLIFCNGAEGCNETSDSCTHSGDPCPDDGDWCNGGESCNEAADRCDSEYNFTTNPRCADDSVWCNGGESCDEDGNQCVSQFDGVITFRCTDDGDWCNGAESCDEAGDECISEFSFDAPRCENDNLWCNGVEYCNEGDDICESTVEPCQNDGYYCNGAESCDEAGDECDHSGNPCVAPTEYCFEDVGGYDCTEGCDPGQCMIDMVCYDNLERNPENPCEVCNIVSSEDSWSSGNAGYPCDDGLWCNGEDDTCNDSGECAVHATSPCNELTEECNEVQDICTPWPQFVPIDAGIFDMGSPGNEPGRESEEILHEVTLTNDFEIMITAVTQSQFENTMGYNPSSFPACGGDCPADTTSWYDSAAFTVKLSIDDGLAPCYVFNDIVCEDDNPDSGINFCKNNGGIKSANVTLNGVSSVYDCEGYRLPTEAEWEYATRAETTTAYNNGLDADDGHLACETPFHLEDIAWYCANAASTQPVGLLTANNWGLYDMSGNVWERVWDWEDAYLGDVTNPEGPAIGARRCNRGCAWYSSAKYCRSADRDNVPPGYRNSGLGFRIARTLDPPPVNEGFAHIRGGTFSMGSPDGTGVDPLEPGRESDETQHEVTLTNDFEMSIYETTQVEFTSLMGWNPSEFGPNGLGADCGDDCPVEWVTWYDSAAYANELSHDESLSPCYTFSSVVCYDGANVGTDYMACMNDTQGGIESATVALNGVGSVYDCEGYRLPTEAEWEYAIRGGTTTAFYNGSITNTGCSPLDPNLDVIGWYCGNDSNTTEVVGQKLPNLYGLYDMSGNVIEWNWDWFGTYPGTVTDPEGPGSGSQPVRRGGGWYLGAGSCRSANRSSNLPGNRYNSMGFRLARSLNP
jgi:formylglycine-generating enzyme required for sulfatase activity